MAGVDPFLNISPRQIRDAMNRPSRAGHRNGDLQKAGFGSRPREMMTKTVFRMVG
jgi:hypothetical protein